MKNKLIAAIKTSLSLKSSLMTAGLSLASVPAWAGPTTVELWRDMGLSAALLGGGIAHTTDASATDRNPAGISLERINFASGEIGWTRQKLRQAEASACDAETSVVAACFKFRQTQKVTGARDRRYSLALADSFGDGLFLGVAGDYVQFGEERFFPATPTELKNAQRARAGAVYVLQPGLSAGVYADGFYDSTGYPMSHGAGLSARLGQYFLFNGDFLFDRDALRELIAGVSVFPRDFLDFAVSYGYDPRVSQHRFGGGVVVKSQQARIIYTLVRSPGPTPQLLQTFGISVFGVWQ